MVYTEVINIERKNHIIIIIGINKYLEVYVIIHYALHNYE